MNNIAMNGNQAIVVVRMGDCSISRIEYLLGNFKPKVRNHYLEWIMFLTNGCEEELQKVIKLYIELGSWGCATMAYRKQCRDNGRGNVSSVSVYRAYNRRDISSLRALLSERFLENLTMQDIGLFLHCLERRRWDINRMFERLVHNPERRLMSTVL